MPDGTKLKKAKLRGVESQGMILSERELQLSDEHTGIMVLEDAIVPGHSARGRGADLNGRARARDHAQPPRLPRDLRCGARGARRHRRAAEARALGAGSGQLRSAEGIEITNEAGPELCPRFTARILEDIKLGASPLWLKARLMACGQRPISNVVDITNYVMLLTGQPMHAFDYERVAGRRLNVRRARAGEQLQTLDEQTRTLDPEIVVIEDADGPTSLAGVMGGARSEVSDSTTSVLSEVATWNGPNIHAHWPQAGAAQ